MPQKGTKASLLQTYFQIVKNFIQQIIDLSQMRSKFAKFLRNNVQNLSCLNVHLSTPPK